MTGKVNEQLFFLSNCQNLETLWNGHTQCMQNYGFDRLIYGYTRFRFEGSLGDPEDFIILTNHEADYTKVFLNERHYLHAPMVNWALHNEGASSWGILEEMKSANALSEEELRMIAFNQSMGVTAGYTISFNSVSARSKGAIALTAERGMSQEEVDEIWKTHGADIHLLNNMAHLKILSLPNIRAARSLTRRQIEALEWIADGKTVQDTAMLMGLTVGTVEKHLRLARETLSVETTAQAILKVAFSNQMFVLEA